VATVLVRYGAESTERISAGTALDTGKQPPSDRRSTFARDRDRLLYAGAFRRLAGKTQVVAAGDSGQYHTRLTHSLKVAQLGRRLAEQLRHDYAATSGGSVDLDLLPPDPDLVETACLAHDLGHPPFGHAGETALREAFDELSDHKQEKGGFQGNAQTFRILSFLASGRLPYVALDPPKLFGLDLSRASLDAASKYPWPRGLGAKTGKSWGVYPEDMKTMEWVRGVAPTESLLPAFEAQLMDWCDDVTYAVHDVMDFYRAGMIPVERIFPDNEDRGAGELSDEALAFLSRIPPEDRESWEGQLPGYAPRVFRRLAELWEIFEPWAPTRKLRGSVHTTMSQLITYFTQGVGWTGEAPCRHSGTLRIHPDDEEARERRVACELLKKLIWVYVIDNRRLATQQYGQRAVVRGLLRIVTEEPDRLLPEDRREELDQHGSLHRAACDHVASLTEAEALVLHARFTGSRMGAVTDPV
jgi:dGTPase